MTRRPIPPRRPRRTTRIRLHPRPPKPSYWRRRLGAVVAFGAIVGAPLFINATFQPFHGDGRGAVNVSIPPGADASQIGDRLAAAGVVDSGWHFMVNATLTGRRGKLKPGDYTLRRGMSNGQAVEALQQGPKAKIVRTFSITIPEGRSRSSWASRSTIEAMITTS